MFGPLGTALLALGAIAAEPPVPSARVAEATARAAAVDEAERPALADALWCDVLRLLGPEGERTLEAAAAWRGLGAVALARGELDTAESHLTRALDLREALEPESESVAQALNALGRVHARRGRHRASEAAHRRAAAILASCAPDAVEHGRALYFVAAAVDASGDRAPEAEDGYRRALSFAERHAGARLVESSSLGGLARLARLDGDLEEAERLYRRALAITEAASPARTATALTSLAALQVDRGDLASAEANYRSALALQEEREPRSLEVARTLAELAVLAARRGDAAARQDAVDRAVAIAAERAPGSPDHARYLHAAGLGALADGRLDDAEAAHLSALSMRRRAAPADAEVAQSLHALANVALARGDERLADEWLAAADGQYARARRERGPYLSLLVALADRALARGECDLAAALARAALDRERSVARGTASEASASFAMARATWRAGKTADAEVHFCETLEAFEAANARLGEAERELPGQAGRHGTFYREFAAFLAERGRPSDAFRVSERGRMRSLRRAGRKDGHAAARPRAEAARREIDAAYDRALARLAAGPGPGDRGALLEELRGLRHARVALADRERRDGPPDSRAEPIGLEAAGAALDEGTLLLSYVVREDDTLLFTARRAGRGPAATALHRLPFGDANLRRRIDAFRRVIRNARGSDAPRPFLEAASALGRDLLGPVSRELVRARRVLVVPDGPLRVLPFAALVTRVRGRDRYLVESAAIGTALSATRWVAGHGAGAAPIPRETRIEIFGDPDPAPGPAPLPRLPGARLEMNEIERLFGARATVHAGSGATEDAVRAAASRATHFHFACHAALDERFPLDSSLSLTPGGEGGGNGALQAWEIAELPLGGAELVALSGCETALGAEMGGEGLVGLTRAFLGAGARAVLASLWNVEDASTANLVARFYRHLVRGAPAVEALRRAQVEVLRGGATPPAGWAGFLLVEER